MCRSSESSGRIPIIVYNKEVKSYKSECYRRKKIPDCRDTGQESFFDGMKKAGITDQNICNSCLRSGVDGSRTRVQKPIPCPSTIIVPFCGQAPFPRRIRKEQPMRFGSFIIRPRGQSLARVVSHIVEAPILACECVRRDCCN